MMDEYSENNKSDCIINLAGNEFGIFVVSKILRRKKRKKLLEK